MKGCVVIYTCTHTYMCMHLLFRYVHVWKVVREKVTSKHSLSHTHTQLHTKMVYVYFMFAHIEDNITLHSLSNSLFLPHTYPFYLRFDSICICVYVCVCLWMHVCVRLCTCVWGFNNRLENSGQFSFLILLVAQVKHLQQYCFSSI